MWSSLKRVLFEKRLVWLSHSDLGRLTHFRDVMCQFVVIVVTGVNFCVAFVKKFFSIFIIYYYVAYIILFIYVYICRLFDVFAYFWFYCTVVISYWFYCTAVIWYHVLWYFVSKIQPCKCSLRNTKNIFVENSENIPI